MAFGLGFIMDGVTISGKTTPPWSDPIFLVYGFFTKPFAAATRNF